MSNIRTRPSSPLTTCGRKRKVDWSLSLPPKPGIRNEASPAVSNSVTATAADHSHHSCFSILRKFIQSVSGDTLFSAAAPSPIVGLIADHRLVAASRSSLSYDNTDHGYLYGQ